METPGLTKPSFTKDLPAQGLPQTQLLQWTREAVSECGGGSTGVLRGQHALIQAFASRHPGNHLAMKHPLSLSDVVPAHQALVWSPPQHPSPP